MCAKTESTRSGEGTDPFLKICTNRSSQAVCHISACKCLSLSTCRVRHVVQVCQFFVNFCIFVIIVCLDVCMLVGGRCLSLPFGWTHMSEGLLPSTELFHHPSIPCFQRGGDVGELPPPPLVLRPSLSPSNRAVWSGTWEWKQEKKQSTRNERVLRERLKAKEGKL